MIFLSIFTLPFVSVMKLTLMDVRGPTRAELGVNPQKSKALREMHTSLNMLLTASIIRFDKR